MGKLMRMRFMSRSIGAGINGQLSHIPERQRRRVRAWPLLDVLSHCNLARIHISPFVRDELDVYINVVSVEPAAGKALAEMLVSRRR